MRNSCTLLNENYIDFRNSQTLDVTAVDFPPTFQLWFRSSASSSATFNSHISPSALRNNLVRYTSKDYSKKKVGPLPVMSTFINWTFDSELMKRNRHSCCLPLKQESGGKFAYLLLSYFRRSNCPEPGQSSHLSRDNCIGVLQQVLVGEIWVSCILHLWPTNSHGYGMRTLLPAGPAHNDTYSKVFHTK